MKVCPKCGGLLGDHVVRCPTCDTDTSLEIVYDKVETVKEERRLQKERREKRKKAAMLVLFALLLIGGVTLANWLGTFRWYSVLLAVYGFITLFFPGIYQKLYFLFFVRGRQYDKPTAFYYALHIVTALAAWVFAIMLPLWKFA